MAKAMTIQKNLFRVTGMI